jgi:hypothetical protein
LCGSLRLHFDNRAPITAPAPPRCLQYRLLGPGEELPDLLKLSSEDVLLRWLNFHVAGRNGIEKVTNFGEALKDGCVVVR